MLMWDVRSLYLIVVTKTAKIYRTCVAEQLLNHEAHVESRSSQSETSFHIGGNSWQNSFQAAEPLLE